MQEFLRIPNPARAACSQARCTAARAVVRHADWVRPGVECEMVVSLERRLGPEAGAVHPRNRGRGSRRGDGGNGDRRRPLRRTTRRWIRPRSSPTTSSTPAACWARRLPTGARSTSASLTGVTRINGVEAGRGRGVGRDGPSIRGAGLAGQLRWRDAAGALRAGEFVFTGSVVETKWLNRGDSRGDDDRGGLGWRAKRCSSAEGVKAFTCCTRAAKER